MKPAQKLLFNIDANVWMYSYRKTSAFFRPRGQRLTAADIHHYVDVIADAGVDVLTVNGHCTQHAYYPSKVVPTCIDGYRRGDRSFFFGHLLGWEMTPEQLENYLAESVHLMDGYVDLVEAGVDWLAETAKACRRRGITPWVSIRMNDMHGATKLPQFSYMNGPLYADPAMRLRGTTYNPQGPVANGWKGFNYEKPEVRKYILDSIRDMVENYDYEGLQLEWNRMPLCCEPGCGQPAIDTITNWHDEVRELTRKQGRKIGKHYTLGIKYMGTVEQMRAIGIDLLEMARRDVIDYLAPTNSWQSSWDIPCDELKSQVGEEVAVYGSIEFCPNMLHGYLPEEKQGNPSIGSTLPINYRLTPYSPEFLRGNAAAKLVLGVHGIEIYNFPCADQTSHWPFPDAPGCAQYPAVRGLQNLEGLRGLPKAYTLSSQQGYYIHPYFEGMAAFPCVLTAGERRSVRLPMCREPESSGLELVIQLVVQKKDKLPPIGLYVNGSWPRFDGVADERLLFPVATMTHHTPDQVGLNFTYPLNAIREGWNEIIVFNGAARSIADANRPSALATDGADAVTVVSLEAAVRGKG